jgi:hypothetical protein
MKKALVFFGFFTAAGICVYWSTVLLGLFPVDEPVPGYRSWFMAFPLADLWIAACSSLLSIFLLRENNKWMVFGLLAGSSLIFLGLYALMYGINTGLLLVLTPDEAVEIIIKAYCLGVGLFTIGCCWRELDRRLIAAGGGGTGSTGN